MTTQSDAILESLAQAIRAGFSVTFAPAGSSVEVTVKPVAIVAGTASDRVEAFTVIRASLVDAAANSMNVVILEIGLDMERKRMSEKPYRVSYGYCHENRQDFATFAEALAFYQTHPGGSWGENIYNVDRVDVVDSWDDDGRQGMSDGLTEEEHEATL